MLMGILYFVIILLACILGAIVGLGGGVFIRPIFDAIGYHNVLNISFFSSSAILTMAIVSTIKKLQDGTRIDVKIAVLISSGAVVGGMLGNLLLERLVSLFAVEASVQYIQIVVTVLVLGVSIFLTIKGNLRYDVKNKVPFCLIAGVILGSVAAFLGIGGGPINVPVMMIFFGLPIKTATAYSIVIIFFSHFSRLVTMGVTVGYNYFDLPILMFVIPAAAIGGLLGAKYSKLLPDTTVKKMFIVALSAVIVLNVVNGLFII